MAQGDLTRSLFGAIIRIQRLLKDPSRLMKQIGAIILIDAQKAFRLQKLGDITWPVRYPRQTAPYVNVAGVVSDFAQGKNPPARRFQNKPVLRDTSRLLQSLASRTTAVKATSHLVEVGTTVPYGGLHQWGGESKQPLTPAVRTNLAKFLRSKKGKPYRRKLGWLFQRQELKTKVHARPFLGITDDAEKKILALLKSELERSAA